MAEASRLAQKRSRQNPDLILEQQALHAVGLEHFKLNRMNTHKTPQSLSCPWLPSMPGDDSDEDPAPLLLAQAAEGLGEGVSRVP